MKKTLRKYLEDCKHKALNDRFNSSENYLMSKPKAGMEKEFAQSLRDCVIVQELMELVHEYPTSDDPDVICVEDTKELYKAIAE